MWQRQNEQVGEEKQVSVGMTCGQARPRQRLSRMAPLLNTRRARKTPRGDKTSARCNACALTTSDFLFFVQFRREGPYRNAVVSFDACATSTRYSSLLAVIKLSVWEDSTAFEDGSDGWIPWRTITAYVRPANTPSARETMPLSNAARRRRRAQDADGAVYKRTCEGNKT